MGPYLQRAAVSALALAALTTASNAYGGDCDFQATSGCIDSDVLWPRPGSSRFASTGSTETLAAGAVGFGMFTSYQSRPLRLRVPSPGPPGSNVNVIDNQISSTFLFAYGLTDRLQLGLAVPITLIQNGTGRSAITGGTDLRDTSFRDMRFDIAYALVPRARVAEDLATPGRGAGRLWSLALRWTLVAPTGDPGQFASNRGVVFAPSLAGDLRTGRWFFGAELGARIRPVSEFAGTRIGTQIVTSFGGGFDALERGLLSPTAELFFLPTLTEQATLSSTPAGFASTPNGSHIFPAEWRLGLRSTPTPSRDLELSVGGGGAIPLTGDAAPTTPRFRFTLGIGYAPKTLDSDGDGVPDGEDMCPGIPGQVKTRKRKGCPAPPSGMPMPPTTEAPSK